MNLKFKIYLSITALLRIRCNNAFSPPSLFRSSTWTPLHADLSDTHFDDLGLTDDLIGVTEKMRWTNPTAVQQLSIPSILEMAEGNDYNSLWCEVCMWRTNISTQHPLLTLYIKHYFKAPTGTGKTGGFCIPLLQIMLQRKRDVNKSDEGHVCTLILSPTRELAAQTADVIRNLVSHLPKRHRSSITVEAVYGGVPLKPQISALANRRKTGTTLDFLVATPGRLVDILKHEDEDPNMSALEMRILKAFEEKSLKSVGKGRRGRPAADASLTLNDIQEMELDRVSDDGLASLNELLSQLNFLVFDEADRLLSGAFLDEIKDLMTLLPPRGQNDMKVCLFSATFPEEVEKRIDTVLSKLSAGTPLRVSTTSSMQQRVQLDDAGGISHRKEKRLANTTPISSVAKDFAPNIKHRVIRLNERDRTQALRRLIEQNSNEWNQVLVFVGTRYHSEHVTRKLRRYGIKAAELHGKLDQEARERRLKSFRNGNTQVLLSTDLAARGLDVEGLPVVINYDLPRGAADFTHRTGRTGRAGREGLSVTFVTATKESHFDFIEKKELGGLSIEREVLEGFEPNEDEWLIRSTAEETSIPGIAHSQKGLAHDRMFGGVKGRKKSKKDKLREAAVKAQAGS